MITKQRLEKEYRWVHKNTTTMSGSTTIKNKDSIKNVIQRIQPISVLDYGCGKGWQYTRKFVHEEWGIQMPVLYDPYVEGINKLASYSHHYFDLVLCVDVMEHILPEETDQILHELFFLGNYIYFHIDTKKALKKFSDGTNFHVNIQEPDWWINKLNEYGKNYHADFR